MPLRQIMPNIDKTRKLSPDRPLSSQRTSCNAFKGHCLFLFHFTSSCSVAIFPSFLKNYILSYLNIVYYICIAFVVLASGASCGNKERQSMASNISNDIRLRYLYRDLILRGKAQVSFESARNLIGPDCAFHLYGRFSTKGSKTSLKSRRSMR